MASGENKKSWIDLVREATVALGTVKQAKVQDEKGEKTEKNIFAVVGTGVILGIPDDQSKTPWIVTAKHVFHDPTKNWDPDTIQLRFAWFEEKGIDEYLGIKINLKKNGKRLWTPHPNNQVDLAAMPLIIPKQEAGRDSLPIIPLGNFATGADLYEGAAVLIFGFPGAVGPSFWTKALVRSGIIAWVHPSAPEEQPLLIDAMVFPGNSGGPVFRIPTGIDRYGNFIVGGKPSFLGIVSQGRRQAVPLTAGGKEIELQGPAGPMKIVSEDWIGVGIVEPASKVLELLKFASENKP